MFDFKVTSVSGCPAGFSVVHRIVRSKFLVVRLFITIGVDPFLGNAPNINELHIDSMIECASRHRNRHAMAAGEVYLRIALLFSLDFTLTDDIGKSFQGSSNQICHCGRFAVAFNKPSEGFWPFVVRRDEPLVRYGCHDVDEREEKNTRI